MRPILEAKRARTVFSDAESKLNSAKERKRDDEDELAELFEPEGFGPEGEWKKLQNLCLSMDTGEYVHAFSITALISDTL